MDFNISIKVEDDDGDVLCSPPDKYKRKRPEEHEQTDIAVKEHLHKPEINVKIESIELNPESEDVIMDFILKEEMDIGPTEIQEPCIQRQFGNASNNIERKKFYLVPSEEHPFTEIEYNGKNIPSKKKHKTRSQKEQKLNDPYPCDICSASFSYIGNYKRHVKEFHEENSTFSYSCDRCNKTFKRKYSLKRHQRSRVRCIVKKKANMFKCHCGRSFKQKGNFLRHRDGYCEVSQTNCGVYICDLCKKVFPNRIRLSVHLSHHKRTNTIK